MSGEGDLSSPSMEYRVPNEMNNPNNTSSVTSAIAKEECQRRRRACRSAVDQPDQEWYKWPTLMEGMCPITLGNIDAEGGSIAGHVRCKDVLKHQPSHHIHEGRSPRHRYGKPCLRVPRERIRPSWQSVGRRLNCCIPASSKF